MNGVGRGGRVGSLLAQGFVQAVELMFPVALPCKHPSVQHGHAQAGAYCERLLGPIAGDQLHAEFRLPCRTENGGGAQGKVGAHDQMQGRLKIFVCRVRVPKGKGDPAAQEGQILLRPGGAEPWVTQPIANESVQQVGRQSSALASQCHG